MKDELFDINNFNVIQDSEYYYFFRALNNGDNNDMEQQITTVNGELKIVHTDRERFKGVSKYNDSSTISLQEVFEHVKINNFKGTNCISLTSNANVAVDYGRGFYNDSYVMVKIPKKEFGATVVNAGSYMLHEVDKKIQEIIFNEDLSDDALTYLDLIEEANNQEELNAIKTMMAIKTLESQSDNTLQKTVKYKVVGTENVGFQSLSEEQILVKDKLALQLQVLKNEGVMDSVLENVSDGFLFSTIGGAFSSTEYIHYNSILEKNIVSIPKELAIYKDLYK